MGKTSAVEAPRKTCLNGAQRPGVLHCRILQHARPQAGLALNRATRLRLVCLDAYQQWYVCIKRGPMGALGLLLLVVPRAPPLTSCGVQGQHHGQGLREQRSLARSTAQYPSHAAAGVHLFSKKQTQRIPHVGHLLYQNFDTRHCAAPLVVCTRACSLVCRAVFGGGDATFPL